jgi:hypothetical protein
MEWLKKVRSKREKHSKPSVEKVVVERKVSWEVTELPQLGVVVKFFLSTKLKCVFNNALMHNDREIEKITKSICLRWDVENFVDGVYAIPRPGNGRGGFVINTEESWSFYWSMRRLIGLENIEMKFDNIAVKIFPVLATSPVCEKQFIRVKPTEHFDITIGESNQKCAADML